MRAEEVSIDIKQDVHDELKQKGWFWKKLGSVFLDQLLPIIISALMKGYTIQKK